MVSPVLVGFLALAIAVLVVFAVAVVRGARRQETSVRSSGMAISILPRSPLGWWSVGLAVTFLLALLAITGLLGDDLLDSEGNQTLALVLKIVFIAMSGASFAAGLVSLIKRKESSLVVLVGMLVTLWLGLVTMVAHLFME